MAPPTIAHLKPMNYGSHFRAYSLRGGETAEPIDPILGVDHAWISAPTFPPHPHAGFSAVSYLFLDSETGVDNRDSLGNHNLISPGGLHWTAAGRGLMHEEFPVETGKTVHMLQIFVNLAREQQSDAPRTLSLAPGDVPVVQLPGVKIRVPLGSYGEARSPLIPPTEVCLLDISLDEGAELLVPIAAGQSAFVMPIHGQLTVNGQHYELDKFTLPAFPAQATSHAIALTAHQGRVKAVLFTGSPLRQPVHWQGPMALASTEALAAALAAYQHGDFGTLDYPIAPASHT
ncbi:pirin family protein [Massilia antarctica]|uniref:pirin family protein n=1 Tax=Massilia antarctica TaxID=2765360 RepID=UPI0006BB9358|nr:pirin family protein [Massilia sp. H27-R4]MCY0914947.1 pirin family protein [Massilia sp. H27-R4]CUI06912.1 Pirin [Janthinobacterium sp. CG23_2]CUU30698.1 Pirin [Janthinobacterium sp. CG23_2]